MDNSSCLDILLVNRGVEKLESDIVLKVIEKYCKNGISILLMGVRGVIMEQLKKMCVQYNVSCKTESEIQYTNNLIDYRNLKYSLTQQVIETPIVSVAGVVPITQKYQIQLNLLSNFSKDGYKVTLIGTGFLNELIGAYSVDNILFCRNLPEIHKIYFFNSFLKEIEKRDKPDVIIIDIEDSLLPLSEKHSFNYGIYASELYSAFSPDISIIALMNGIYNDEFFEEFGKLCKFKYNFEASAYFVSRYVPLSSSMHSEKLSYAYADVMQNVSNKYIVFSNDDIEQKKLYHFVLKKLQQYGRCEQF